MIHDPIIYIKSKINHMVWSMVLIGLIFIFLGIAVIFFPQIVQYIFVIGFVLIGLSAFVFALRLSHISDVLTNIDIFKR